MLLEVLLHERVQQGLLIHAQRALLVQDLAQGLGLVQHPAEVECSDSTARLLQPRARIAPDCTDQNADFLTLTVEFNSISVLLSFKILRAAHKSASRTTDNTDGTDGDGPVYPCNPYYYPPFSSLAEKISCGQLRNASLARPVGH